MSSEVTCEKVREVGTELALGVLPGRERAGAVAHLDECAGCREYVEQLTLVGDGLIGLLPGSEPPVGFEARVAQSLTQEKHVREARGHGARMRGPTGRDMAHETSVHETSERETSVREAAVRETHPRPGGHSARRKGGRGRIRPRVAAVAAAVLAAVGFGGWAAGTAIENVIAGPAATSVGTDKEMLSGDLISTVAQNKPSGEVYAHTDPEGWVYMTVDLAEAGNPFSGKIVCLLEHKDGSTVRVGTFTLRDGRGSWGSQARVDPSAVSGARVATPDGTVLASAHLGPGDVGGDQESSASSVASHLE
ncbi:anti-sigma factor family protein [Streptomyces sp. 142MFCol3.1]|uniref:anti-sigma factor family protein n=1 Tax=Streptomyces sp. 142MFCol3.1 TaxID=1172179 RepID=UPI0004254DC1|nr:zf-HC2 domain-containing protein [Streptomyces sp. 142MFCol3.1]